MSLSERRKYRKFTQQQKLELVVASLRGDRSVAELCREHELSETLLRRSRDQVLEAGAERLAGNKSARPRPSCARRSPSWSALWAARSRARGHLPAVQGQAGAVCAVAVANAPEAVA